MKKFISLLVIILIVGVAFFVNTEYSGQTYYTKITDTGKKVIAKANDGKQVTNYEYELKSANDKGETKGMKFTAPDSTKPLKMNAYLKLEYNNKKGVLNWEEVEQSKVPDKAMNKLNK